MYRITNNKDVFELDFTNNQSTKGHLNQREFIIKLKENSPLKVKYKGKYHRVDLLSIDELTKEVAIRINGVRHQLKLEDDMDILLKRLGMDRALDNKMKELKAPMPGLVLKILVKEGEEVQKNTPLLILEAMKMENSIKATASGVVKEIKCKEGTAVEKNEVLLSFE